MLGTDLTNKRARLQELLQTFGQGAVATGRDALMPREPGMVAVAFSGGVDSTLLLRMACDTLGPENVTALHAVSCLIPDWDQKKAQELVTGADGIGCAYRAVRMQPLQWPEFVANSEQRCYFCKKKIYSALQTEIRQDDFPAPLKSSLHVTCLLDGTNADDLQEHRPGLQAIRELSVETPLARAGLGKKDVRSLARELGLSNWNQPSNSCLATRIAVHQAITLPLLQRIAQAEHFLQRKGFAGCRVQPDQYHNVTLQVMPQDLERCAAESFHPELLEHLEGLGFGKVILVIKGRNRP